MVVHNNLFSGSENISSGHSKHIFPNVQKFTLKSKRFQNVIYIYSLANLAIFHQFWCILIHLFLCICLKQLHTALCILYIEWHTIARRLINILWIHFYSWYTNFRGFRGCQQTTNLNVRRKMTIWFPFGGKQGFDNTNICSHVGNSTLLHDVIVMHVLWI